MNRRNFLTSAASVTVACTIPGLSLAQTGAEIAVGVIYPMSGPSAQIGVDAKHAFETATDIVNGSYDIHWLEGYLAANGEEKPAA